MLSQCKGTICHPYINIMYVHICGTQRKVDTCMCLGDRQVILFVGWLIIGLVRLMLGFSLFGILSQLSRTSSSSKRRWESVMNLMYWLVRVISSLYRVLSVTYWCRKTKTIFSNVSSSVLNSEISGFLIIKIYSIKTFIIFWKLPNMTSKKHTSWMILSEAESSLVFFKGEIRGSTWAL